MTDEEKEELKEQIEKEGIELTDFELGVIGGMVENGLDEGSFSTEELKCLPAFLKAEACTQFLDLRKNDKKFDSNGNYTPAKLEEIGENEVPGVILVQRTNTKSNTPVYLEYLEQADFDKLVSESNKDAINFFTINEKGNLVIAEWQHTIVTVDGEYPENLDDSEKVQAKNEYIISSTEIPYSQYVNKYTMPFNFLTQLLVITEDVNFCMDLVDIVLNSKIVINIQEEEIITTTVNTTDYTVHSKENKLVSYEIPNIETKTDYLIEKTEDDEQNKCTSYNKEVKKVVVTTTDTSHTYNFEILEADTWIVLTKRTYKAPEEKNENSPDVNINYKGEEYEPKEIINVEEVDILKDRDVLELKQKLESEYRNKIESPRVYVSSYEEGILKKKYKKININTSYDYSTSLYQYNYEEQEITDEEGNVTYTYNMPEYFTVTSKQLNNDIAFGFKKYLYSDEYYNYSNNINDKIVCNINALRIEPFIKMDVDTIIKTNVKRYVSDSEPTTTSHIYAKDDNGNFEKFLLAYDNNEDAREMMNTVDSWLFEVMEEDSTTISLLDTIKYLLYIYSGKDYGITELNLDSLFATDMKKSYSGNSLEQFLKFLHSWEGGGTIYKDANGVDCYKVQPDGGGGSAVGYGVDIATHGAKLRNLGYDTSIGALIPVEIVDEIEKGEVEMVREQVKSITAGLDLTEYQIYALMSRCYNYGVAGGLKRATSSFRYPSNETFVTAYNKYYTTVNNEEYFGDYTKTDFNNQLFTQYMTWLDYAGSGTHPIGWEYRRKSEWSLFQTGYYGYDLKYGSGHGMDEYYSPTGGATEFTNGLNLYNDDMSVNKDAINQLSDWITVDLLNTKIHTRTSEMQGGPFAKWWDSNNNWFTSAGYKFQCTWYVYGRANQYLEMFGDKYKAWPGTRNNATNWYAASSNGGAKYFECGSTPRENSIAVWSNGSAAGHVAYVEAVDTINNKVYVSHAGSGKSWFGISEYGIDEMRNLWGSYRLQGYVYLDSPK